MVAPDASAGLECVTSVDFLALAAWSERDISGLHCVAELVTVGRGDHIAGLNADRSAQLYILSMSRNHRPSIRPPKRIVGEQPVYSQIEQTVKRAFRQCLIRCLYSPTLGLNKGGIP